VTVTINALPGAPSAGNVIACFDGNVHTGSATVGAGESVVWYTAATGAVRPRHLQAQQLELTRPMRQRRLMRPDARAARAL
jgi:hypothetical protein